jgi:hypothetical protein
VRAVSKRAICCWDELCAGPPPKARRLLTEIAVHALADTWYLHGRTGKFVYFRKDGRPSRGAVRQVKYLMGMPRIQESVATALDAANCGPTEAATEVAVIALGKSKLDPQTQALQLRALDMVIRLTTGYVPTRAMQLTAKVAPDQFFDEDEFKDAPPIAPVEQEPRNVTQSQGGGNHRNHRRR